MWGPKEDCLRTSGNKAQITVVVSVSATGNTIPPFVIFDAKNVNLEWTRGEVPVLEIRTRNWSAVF